MITRLTFLEDMIHLKQAMLKKIEVVKNKKRILKIVLLHLMKFKISDRGLLMVMMSH